MPVQLSLSRTAGMFLALSITACGGGSGGNDNSGGNTPPSETVMPTASITFPPSQSITQADSVIVRGSASDNIAVTAVSVNGVSATSTDNFATWSATVPLTAGANALTVSAADAAGNHNTSAAQVQIDYQPRLLFYPTRVALDSSNNRLLVIDIGLNPFNDSPYKGLVAFDPTTGIQTVLSDSTTPDTDNIIRSPRGLVVDADNNRALVLDSNLSALIAVDLNTGARTIIADDTRPNADVELATTLDMVLDSANNRVLTLGRDAIISIDLTSGVKTILTDPTHPNTDNALRAAGRIALDSANNRALVVEKSGEIFGIVAVDLDTGARTILSSALVPNATNLFSTSQEVPIAVDSANNRLLLGDAYTDAMFAIDLSTGARTVLFDASTAGVSDIFAYPTDIAIDTANNRAIIADGGSSGLLAMDLSTHVLTIMERPDSKTSRQSNLFSGYEAMVFDSNNNRLLLGNDGPDISTVNTSTGEQTALVDTERNRSGDRFIALDDTNNRIIIASFRTLQSLDLNTGVISQVSSHVMPSAENLLANVKHLSVDGATNTAYLPDVGASALFSVDLATGVRSVLSDSSTPDTTNPLRQPYTALLDKANNRLLVLDRHHQAVYAVNLSTGARTVISDSTTPDATNAMDDPRSLILDAANNRMLVADIGLGALLAIDLDSGARTIISDNTTPNADNAFNRPMALALDSANNRVLVMDDGIEVMLAVDLSSGARTVFSNETISGIDSFDRISSILMDHTNNRLLAARYNSDVIYAINLSNGVSTPINEITDLLLRRPGVMDMDIVNNRAVILDQSYDRLIAMDNDTGVFSVISSEQQPSSPLEFYRPKNLIVDAANNRALVIENERVLAADLTTGERSIVSSATVPNTENAMQGSNAIALDAGNNRAIIPTRTDDGHVILAMDLSTGARSVLSGADTQDSADPWSLMEAAVVDSTNNRALVLNRYRNLATKTYTYSIIAVDLTTGARSVFSDNTTPNAHNPLIVPTYMTLDTEHNRLLVGSDDLPEILAVDLVDGQRVILSR